MCIVSASSSCVEVMTYCWAVKPNEKRLPISANDVQMDRGVTIRGKQKTFASVNPRPGKFT